MAIATATLTVQISESITLNGQPINSSNSVSIASIKDVIKRTVTVPLASETSLVTLAAAAAAGALITGNLKYLRITNTDATNFLRLRVKKAGAEAADFRIDAGKSMIICNSKLYVHQTSGAFAAFVDWDTISVQPDTAAIDVEIFAACI
jgi:hypothetical protein